MCKHVFDKLYDVLLSPIRWLLVMIATKTTDFNYIFLGVMVPVVNGSH